MAVIKTKYSVGDTVYHAGTTTEQRQHDCPDCNNTRRWAAKSPAGDEFDFPCPRCSVCYSAHDELSLKYTASAPRVQKLTIGSVRFDSHQSPHGSEPPTSYMCLETGVGGGQIYREDRLFETEEGALRMAELLAADSNKNTDWIAKRFNKTFEISDYQLSSAAMKAAKDYESKARSLLYNVSDLFATIEEAESVDAIRDAIADYKSYHWEGDRKDAEKVAA